MEKIILIGNYHNNPLDIYAWKVQDKINTVTIFAHGLYGVFDTDENDDKVNRLVKRLTTKNISHCVIYNSSRDFSFSPNTDYKDRKKAFLDKTFEQELSDLKKVVIWVIENSEKVFGVKSEKLSINIHGTSLGGTLAILLEDLFTKIKKISLCGSGCGGIYSTKPILSTYFAEKDILDSAAKYKGRLLLLQGSEDTVIPKESGLKILKYAINATTKHIVIYGTNHNFSKINGMDDDEAKKQFEEIIFDFISEK